MKVYLGDSIYAEYYPELDFSFALTAENELGATNRIVLGPEVMEALFAFIDHISRQRAAQSSGAQEGRDRD